MPQKPLEQGKIEQARELRRQGAPIEAIASELGISAGAVSKHTRDIAKPAARAPVVKKQGGKKPGEGKAIRDIAGEAALDEETKELANRVKRARLQSELDEIGDRKRQRERLVELEARERELRLELDATRGKAAGGDSSVNGDIRELRQRLDDLREERHRQEIYQVESRHQADMQTLQRQIASQRTTGLTEYDILDRVISKGERAIYRIGDQAHSLFSEVRDDHLAREAVALGIDLDTYLELLHERRPSEFDRRQEMELLDLELQRGERQLTEEESQRLMELQGASARAKATYQARRKQVLNIISQRGRQGEVTLAGRKGKAPAPGEPEPPVLKAESKLVTCSRCQTTFDVDLVELRQHIAPSKRLYVTCPNPKCGFLLDLSDLLGLQLPPKGPAPECYQASPYGCASRGSFSQCRDCQWGDFVSATYE